MMLLIGRRHSLSIEQTIRFTCTMYTWGREFVHLDWNCTSVLKAFDESISHVASFRIPSTSQSYRYWRKNTMERTSTRKTLLVWPCSSTRCMAGRRHLCWARTGSPKRTSLLVRCVSVLKHEGRLGRRNRGLRGRNLIDQSERK